jgi:hypothetical protein
MNNPDHIFYSLETIFLGVKILKLFDADPGSGMETVRIRDPGWKKVGSGIRDKHPGSATLDLRLNREKIRIHNKIILVPVPNVLVIYQLCGVTPSTRVKTFFRGLHAG